MVFDYPDTPYVRRHGPRGYRDTRSWKPWLRDEFAFRCVYCLWRERWCSDGDAAFSVDHLLTRATNSERAWDYDNLVYACCHCNSVKQDEPPVLDPCGAAFAQHLRVQSDGTVRPLTATGAQQIALNRLNRPKLTEARRSMIELLGLLASCAGEQAVQLLQSLQGLPDNLPDLSALRPPGGNTRPEGIAQSYFARRQRGPLPATY